MKNLASAAKGSGVSVPSASRLNTGHWRGSEECVKNTKNRCFGSTERSTTRHRYPHLNDATGRPSEEQDVNTT